MRRATDSSTLQPQYPMQMHSSGDTNGGATTVVEFAAVLPEQIFPTPSVARQSRGEFALMRAVLEDALLCLEKQFVSHTRQTLQLAREADQWICSSDTSWPFSFVNVCTALGLDSDYVRLQLTRRRRGATPPVHRRRRRVMAAQATLSLAA